MSRNITLTSNQIKPILFGSISLDISKILYIESECNERLKLNFLNDIPRFVIIITISEDLYLEKPFKLPTQFKRHSNYVLATALNYSQALARYNFFIRVIKNTYKKKPSTLLPHFNQFYPLERI